MKRCLYHNPCRSVLSFLRCLYLVITAMNLTNLSWFLQSQIVCRRRRKCRRIAPPFVVLCLDSSRLALESKYCEVRKLILLLSILEDLHFNCAKECACQSPPPSLTFSFRNRCLRILRICTFLLFPVEFLELSFPVVLWQGSCTCFQTLPHCSQPK